MTKRNLVHGAGAALAAASAADLPDKAPGKGDWIFAMPLANDDRLQFAVATFDSGKFVSAKLLTMGCEPRALGEAELAKLRDERPTVSMRTEYDDVGVKAAFSPARTRSRDFVLTDDQNLALNPVPRLLGSLGRSLGRLGLSADRLAHRVTVVGRDGLELDLGTVTAKAPVTGAVFLSKARAAIEKSDPSRKGKVSDRDIVDWHHGATARCVPVAP